MVLVVSDEVDSPDVPDIAFVDVSICDQSFPDEFAQPGGGERVCFIVPGAHFR
jgi:hypothetical protein